jgi:hypothetical protein
VNVLYGSARNLSAANDQLWDQNKNGVEGSSEPGDRFGAALSAGDFNHDGFTDLAIGVPGEDIGAATSAGSVNVLYGTHTSLSAVNDQLWQQGKQGVEGSPDPGDEFGAALAAGDFNGDGFADLAIGVPGENEGKGGLNVLDGGPTSLSAPSNNFFE